MLGEPMLTLVAVCLTCVLSVAVTSLISQIARLRSRLSDVEERIVKLEATDHTISSAFAAGHAAAIKHNHLNAKPEPAKKKKKKRTLNQRNRRQSVRSFHRRHLLGRSNFDKKSRALLALPPGFATFREYIEGLFYDHPVTGEEMTWNNLDRWDLHHEPPLDSLNLCDSAVAKRARQACTVSPTWKTDHLAIHAEIREVGL